MAFQEGFLSQLVGRQAVVAGDRPLSVGKVVDFVVNKPDDTFPKIDGIVVKTRDGQRLAPIGTVLDADADGTLRVVAADIGIAGLLRRLAGQRFARALEDKLPNTLISWRDVAPIADVNPSQVRLSVSENRLARLHPADLAEIIGELSSQDAARVVQSLDDETAADALEHLDAERQR